MKIARHAAALLLVLALMVPEAGALRLVKPTPPKPAPEPEPVAEAAEPLAPVKEAEPAAGEEATFCGVSTVLLP